MEVIASVEGTTASANAAAVDHERVIASAEGTTVASNAEDVHHERGCGRDSQG